MQEEEALAFFDGIVNGQNKVHKKTSFKDSGTGLVLEDVEIHPVSKGALASTVSALPEELFAAVDSAETPEEAEKLAEESGTNISAMSDKTVDAFEDLLKESLRHEHLTQHQMEKIVEELSFEKLFELGSQVIDISFEHSGRIKDFHEQD